MKYRRPVQSDRRLKENCSLVDNGPAERWQHSGRLYQITDRTVGIVAVRASEECVLDVLYYQKKISRRQHQAAMRLKADFLAANLAAHLAATYNAAHVENAYYVGCDDRTQAQEVAYQRWRAAIIAIGPLFNDTVIFVVCHELLHDEAHAILLQVDLFKLAKWYALPNGGLYQNVNQTAAGQVGVGCHSGRGDKTMSRGRLLH